jgi:hypothetical protein
MQRVQLETIDTWMASTRLATSPAPWIGFARWVVREWASALPAAWDECSELARLHASAARAVWPGIDFAGTAGEVIGGDPPGLALWRASQASVDANALAALRLHARAARSWSAAWALLEPGDTGNGPAAERMKPAPGASEGQSRLLRETAADQDTDAHSIGGDAAQKGLQS